MSTGVLGVYIVEANTHRKTHDYPSHVIKDAREKLDGWARNILKHDPEVANKVRSAMVDIKALSHDAISKATEQKPLEWKFEGGPVPLRMRIWRVS